MSLDLHRPQPPHHRRRLHARMQPPHMSPQAKLLQRKIMTVKALGENHNQNRQNQLSTPQHQQQNGDAKPISAVAANTTVAAAPADEVAIVKKASTSNATSDAVAPGKKSPTPSEKLIFAPAEGQYLAGALERENLDNDPFIQFHAWFSQASNYPGLTMPEATTLSTCQLPSGRVSARVVYLKELDNKGFVIYSNWETSKKSGDVRSNGQASLTFWWKEMERQVRVEGVTERLTSEQSQTYYNTRIRGSRIGAWASQQSSVLAGREELDAQVKAVEKKFEGQETIPVPPFWGGLRIIPTYIEFWQGRDSRLHDRFSFTRESIEDETWSVDRLSP